MNHAVGLHDIVRRDVCNIALSIFQDDIVLAVHHGGQGLSFDCFESRLAAAMLDGLDQIGEFQFTGNDVIA